jgi:glutaconate CoA-transferase subunit B
VHPGQSLEDIREHTGFDFDVPDSIEQTPPPSDEDLALLRGSVGAAIAETYPAFAKRVLAESGA